MVRSRVGQQILVLSLPITWATQQQEEEEEKAGEGNGAPIAKFSQGASSWQPVRASQTSRCLLHL